MSKFKICAVVSAMGLALIVAACNTSKEQGYAESNVLVPISVGANADEEVTVTPNVSIPSTANDKPEASEETETTVVDMSAGIEQQVILACVSARVTDADELAQLMLLGVEEDNNTKTGVIDFVSPHTGRTYKIDLRQLRDAWEGAEKQAWDNRESHQYTAVIKNFLVDQMGVYENIAFGIMGNCANEGDFGMEQKSYKVFNGVREAITKLDNSKVHLGYGIVQWTTMSRRRELIKFYREADKFDMDFLYKMFVAELVWMYEEMEDYKLFNSWQDKLSVEDACGRVARIYEGYEGSSSEWQVKNGVYYLAIARGTSKSRLAYANRYKELYGTSK